MLHVRFDGHSGGGFAELCALPALQPSCDILAQRPEIDGNCSTYLAGAALARLLPGDEIKPHFDSHCRLSAHLGLRAVEGASMMVGGKISSWQEGRTLVFDDTYVHSVRHHGVAPRYVLLTKETDLTAEDMAAEPTMVAKCTAEFVGTFLLIFTVGCNVLGGSPMWAGVSIAFVLMVCIYALGGISGGNFNPAVSVTLGLSKTIGGPGLDWKTVGMYSGVQCAAGVLAGVSYSLLFGKTFNLAPAKGFSWYHAGLCELLYTFMLTFVVMNVAAAKKNATEKNQYYGMAIAFSVVAGAYGAGAVSGGCFNPAVALGIDLSSAGLGFGWSIVYIGFELLGAAMAATLFKVVRPEDFGGEKSQITELVSEFLGTYMLVLTVGLNILGKSKAAAFSIAASLMSMIYALGDVSGAHFNPAVTVAILASGRCPELTPAKAGTYAGVQIAGGIAAALTSAFEKRAQHVL
eukprot:g24444.t1